LKVFRASLVVAVAAVALAGSVPTVAGVRAAVVCTIKGNSKANKLTGTAGADVICGYGGDDHIYGKGGNDILIGGSGDDWLYGEKGNDLSKGGAGRDVLFDRTGLDTLKAGDGDDKCMDTRDGSGGDHLDGGAGKDYYYANTADTVKNAEAVGVCPPDPP
jgi:Ca2+-binding RTX toxin-like protein